ncbi:hypothetical protein EH165_02405 [Nakamurella antarctica]|uniref:Uncharacterized protein n=2 Tax=Nakamurella antarctica TaxID=1902245 RepID=A0A3G8ZK65_9ACTN|nr:hypothetical protein EH165_02405 [Nakamurella antarctica]
MSSTPGDPILRVAAQLEYPDGTTRTITASSERQAALAEKVEGSAFTLAEAAQLTGRIQQGMDHVQALVVEGFTGRIWIALGLGTWDAWADKFFGNRPMLAFSREERPALVSTLSQAGLSTRAIGAAIGTDQRTVRRDLDSTAANAAVDTTGHGVEARDKIAGTNGKDYNRPTPKPKPEFPQCQVCGELNERCHGGSTCTQWQDYLDNKRKTVPPGPPMPPLPRNAPHVPNVLGHNTIYSNGKGLSSTADFEEDVLEPDEESEPLADAVSCSSLSAQEADDAEIIAEGRSRFQTTLKRLQAVLTDGLGVTLQLSRDIQVLADEATVSGMFPLDADLMQGLQDRREELALFNAELPVALCRLDAAQLQGQGGNG